MAVLRATPQGGTTNCLDGIVQTTDDFSSDRLTAAAVGSLMYCLADGKLYCKTGSGEWAEAE